MGEFKYLTDIPSIVKDYGFSKVLAVRHEIIHMKHIFTEIFVRRNIDIESILDNVGYSLFDYVTYMTNRMRVVHKLSRDYDIEPNNVVKDRRDSFFRCLNMYNGFSNVIVLDFDGVVTSKKFRELYNLCVERCRTEIGSANPNVDDSWFIKQGDMLLPWKINAMKGKKKKLVRLLEIHKRFDNTLYVDNEDMYLDVAWVFGINTFKWDGSRIKKYSLNSK